MTLATEAIDELERLESLRDAWDALAVEAGRPYCSPAWMLAWWRHCRPRGARLGTVACLDGDELVGIAPLWRSPGRLAGPTHRLLGGGLATPVGPLAARGREREVAAALAAALAGSPPRPVRSLRLEGQQGQPSWPELLADAWPGRRPWLHSALPVAVPTVDLAGLDYERWLAGKTQNFRQQARRFRRKLDGEGARFVAVDEAGIAAAVDAFVELHGARWRERGGSNALIDGIVPMLRAVADELLAHGRFRAFALELEGRMVSVQLFVAAGGEVSYWNGGFDERAQRWKPALQTLLFAVGDAMERGDRRMDLGPGAQDYKLRLADGEEAVDTVAVVPRGRAYPLARVALAPYQARWALSRRLTPEAKRRLRRLARR